MTSNTIERDAVLRHLERVLASTAFRQAERSAGLLRYLVERSLDGSGDRLKEYTVGVEALSRGKEFDPRTDPIVRAEASRLRGRLERYYAGDGQSDVVVIELPKGAYAPRFVVRPMPPTEPSGEAASLSPHQPRSNRRLTLWGALGAFAILGTFAAAIWTGRSSAIIDAPVIRLEVQLQSDERIGSDVGTDVVLAPDGSRAVFISVDSLGMSHLRMQRFDRSPPIDLPGTAGARGQFWSPDSRWIGFWAAGQLRKLAVAGGSPVVLRDALDLLGASWGDDGTTIVAALDPTKRLVKINASPGGTPATIVDLSAENASPLWPQILPGGKQVLYTALTGIGADQARIEVVSVADGKRKTVWEGGTFGRYVAPNHLTYVNQGTLYAVRFDLARLETLGRPAPILDDVAYSPQFGYAQISMAATGLAVYRRAPPNGPVVVALVDSAGRRTPLLATPGQYDWPALSPDGKRLALSITESGVPSLSIFTNLNDHPRASWTARGYDAAVWTRDGRYLVARGSRGIVWMSATGGESRSLIESDKISVPWTFAPGDRSLAFAAMDPTTVFDLWTVPIEKTGDALHAGSPSAILRSGAYEVYPAISPDGRWLAYSSNESEPPQVYVRSLGDTSIKVPIGIGGAPRWSRASARLFFATRDQRIMTVSYTTVGGRFLPDAPRQWTPIRLANTGVLSNYDLGPDDRHIVALLPASSDGAQAENHVTRIQLLSDDIRRKAP